MTGFVLLGLAAGTGCSGKPETASSTTTANAPTTTAAHAIDASTTSTAVSVPATGRLPVLKEGPITPGIYAIVPPDLGWAECMADVDCAPPPPHAETMQLEVTVPNGWESVVSNTAVVLAPPLSAEGPDGAGLALGWYPVGLHSEPCRPTPHSTPDILIGPTVDEFVDAVIEHPSLDVTAPVEVVLGGYAGQFLTLTAPSDITGCADWRPWEHGIPAQGADNIWNLWVIDVDGLRVIVHSEEFPGTSEEDRAELRAITESIRFVPNP